MSLPWRNLFISVLAFTGTCASLEATDMWTFSIDKANRPIVGCLKINHKDLSTLWISMNCQKSIVQNIYLCSQGRAVQVFEEKKECESSRESMFKLHGLYTLETDPYNQ